VWCLTNKLNQFRAFCPDTSLLVVAVALLRLLLAPSLGPKCIRIDFNVFVRHHTSVVTIEEANFDLAWQANIRKLQLFNGIIESLYAVCPVSESIARRAGILRGQFQAQGITRSTPDLLIAATALEHQLIIATRNVRDFAACGVQLINPFAAQV
jgi:toxin FitB